MKEQALAFDLVWYRSRRLPVEPNLPLLQRALDQTEGAGRYRAQDWLALLRAQLATLDVGRLIQDVRPFLERPADARLLEPSNLGARSPPADRRAGTVVAAAYGLRFQRPRTAPRLTVITS